MKNTFIINLLILFLNSLQAQIAPYSIRNGSFETINGTTQIFQTPFTQQQLGPIWFAYGQSPNIKTSAYPNISASHGKNFVHLRHKVENLGGSNWKRTGQAFFVYYPMEAGKYYNVKFDLRSSGYFTKFYIIATNGLTPNTSGTQGNYTLPSNVTNNPYNVISHNQNKQFVNINPPGQNIITNTTSWQNRSFTFKATSTYSQLLIIPYIDININNATTKHADFYLDNFQLTGDVAPTRISMVLNDHDSNTHNKIDICDGETVTLDATKSLDTWYNLKYYIQIHKKNSNGTSSNWATYTFNGLPIKPINLSQLYANNGFSFSSPNGVKTEYGVKFAFNSAPNNQWYERNMKIVVDGGPNFNFGVTFVNTPGYSTNRKVKGLPSGNYSYQWYEGSTTNTSVISTSNQIYMTQYTNGVFPYTVRVTDLDSGCSTVKTTNVLYHEIDTIDSNDDGFTFEKLNNLIKIHPNPTTNIINITDMNNVDYATIYTMGGDLIMSSKEKSIDVSSLKKGIYIMKFYNDDRLMETKKFIKN